MSEEQGRNTAKGDVSGDLITVPGASTKYQPEGIVIVEKKDWDLIRGNLDANAEKKGVKKDMFWGGLGLASGSVGGILPVFQKETFNLDAQILIWVILFAIGVVCIIDAGASYLINRKRNKAEKNRFDEFLDRIEQQSQTEEHANSQ